jgi:hypothetical protein
MENPFLNILLSQPPIAALRLQPAQAMLFYRNRRQFAVL